jgi:hypothetical protein
LSTPEADEELVRIYVHLLDRDPPSGERMWARALGEDLYEVRNVPFEAYELNWGDVVHAVAPSEELAPQVRSVVKRSGHLTVRLIVNDDDLSVSERETLFERLNELEAFYEHAGGRLYCFDVEPQADYDEVRSLLIAERDAGRLVFEEAWRPRPTDDAPQDLPDWL